MKIYSDYTEEPEDKFEPLSQEMYVEVYNLEMDGFIDDLPFYLSHLQPGSNILELGCGSGRLSRMLSEKNHRLTGIDLSIQMLKSARDKSSAERYACMDMRCLGIASAFDAVIIPYNTLNLLHDPADIEGCLKECRRVLKQNGLLLLQLFAVPEDHTGGREPWSAFQFQVFDRPQGGKVIKEIKRRFRPDRSLVTMTEQYKIRPMTPGCRNSNFTQTLQLTGWGRRQWLEAIELAGFTVQTAASSYRQVGEDGPAGLLLVAASSP